MPKARAPVKKAEIEESKDPAPKSKPRKQKAKKKPNKAVLINQAVEIKEKPRKIVKESKPSLLAKGDTHKFKSADWKVKKKI